MRLLRLISWPYLKKHAVRSLLTVIGIVLGVAVFVAMHTANQAVFFAFERTVDRIAGAAQLQVTAGEAGFPEESARAGAGDSRSAGCRTGHRSTCGDEVCPARETS